MQLQGGSNEVTSRFSLLYYHIDTENDDYCILLYMRLILLLIAAIISSYNSTLDSIYLLPATQRPSSSSPLLFHPTPRSSVWKLGSLYLRSPPVSPRSLILASYRSRHHITTDHQPPRLRFFSPFSFLSSCSHSAASSRLTLTVLGSDVPMSYMKVLYCFASVV
ncbi:hypothetical protein BDV11DRAFT_77788 [Aspergillus similis]